MAWWQFLAPVLAIALAARLEAILIGPYWSWVDMISMFGEYNGSARSGRHSLYRRVAIPGIACFIIVAFWPDTYDLWEAVIIAAGGAGLLLWPLVFGGLPYGVRGLTGLVLYGSLVGAFCATGLVGAYIAEFARSQGGIGTYLADNLIGMTIGGVLTIFFTGFYRRASSSAARRRDE